MATAVGAGWRIRLLMSRIKALMAREIMVAVRVKRPSPFRRALLLRDGRILVESRRRAQRFRPNFGAQCAVTLSRALARAIFLFVEIVCAARSFATKWPYFRRNVTIFVLL